MLKSVNGRIVTRETRGCSGGGGSPSVPTFDSGRLPPFPRFVYDSFYAGVELLATKCESDAVKTRICGGNQW